MKGTVCERGMLDNGVEFMNAKWERGGREMCATYHKLEFVWTFMAGEEPEAVGQMEESEFFDALGILWTLCDEHRNDSLACDTLDEAVKECRYRMDVGTPPSMLTIEHNGDKFNCLGEFIG